MEVLGTMLLIQSLLIFINAAKNAFHITKFTLAGNSDT